LKPIIRKGMQDIKTMTSLQMFRARTSTGALAELTALSAEKERLKAEIQKLESRHAHIKEFLKEIEEKERILYKFVDNPKGIESLEKIESPGSGVAIKEGGFQGTVGNGSLREEKQGNPAPPSSINEIIIKY